MPIARRDCFLLLKFRFKNTPISTCYTCNGKCIMTQNLNFEAKDQSPFSDSLTPHLHKQTFADT